ncbi:MAG: carboxymuconolactone decarboxylase family protein [Trueperaceae bacterium]
MKQFAVPTNETASEGSKAIFESLAKALGGKVPNLYATIGYSPEALGGFLQYVNVLENTSFSKRDVQAIDLATSDVNSCDYCLAAHTTVAKMNGFSEVQTLELRDGSIADSKLRAITRLTRSIVENKGRPDGSLLDAFFDQGFDEKALIELNALIALKTFTNYVHNITQVPVDFPAAPARRELVGA